MIVDVNPAGEILLYLVVIISFAIVLYVFMDWLLVKIGAWQKKNKNIYKPQKHNKRIKDGNL